jgi:putative ABC transport system substrate-binding protein
VAVLANPADPFTKSLLDQVHLAGRTGRIEIAPVAMVREVNEVEAAFADMRSNQAQAIVVQAIFFASVIADLAIKYRLPSAAVLRSYPHAGGLMSYGADVPHLFRRCAALVHKILQGTKPADLPVEQPTQFELVVNLKTARAMGLTVPESFLLRADELIE